MIAIRLQGRLGNQLFQYAFIYTAAKKLNTSFYIDEYIELSSVDKYFERLDAQSQNIITNLFAIKGYKNIFSFYLRRIYYDYSRWFYNLFFDNYEWDNQSAEIQNRTLYLGYFQSELFFKPFNELIKNKFVLKNKYIEEFRAKYHKFYQDKTTITIHIRQTDYKNLQHLNLGAADLTLPVNYYQKVISIYDQEDINFIFISDDVAFVEDNFKHIKNKIIPAGTEIMDFQHLLNSDICILSNSTFSWWGAWLNKKKNKVVYCPRYYMGYHLKKEFPDHIYP